MRPSVTQIRYVPELFKEQPRRSEEYSSHGTQRKPIPLAPVYNDAREALVVSLNIPRNSKQSTVVLPRKIRSCCPAKYARDQELPVNDVRRKQRRYLARSEQLTS